MLGVLILTRNEAARLPACLASLGGLAAKVFVIDSNSEDDTAAIARAAGADIIPFHWNGQYPKKKQWAMDHAAPDCEWFLFLDADERLTPAVVAELNVTLAAPRCDAYWISAQPIWQGKILRGGQRNHKIALLRRGAARFPVVADLHTAMGEVEGHYQPIITGRVGHLRAPMIHDCDPPAAWFARHRRYAEATAQMPRHQPMKHEQGFRAAMKKLFYALPFQDVMIFLYGFVWLGGFLDGRAGFGYAAARAWYYREISRARRSANALSAPAKSGH